MTQSNTSTTGPVVPDSILQAVANVIGGLSAEQKIYVEGYIRGLRGASTTVSVDTGVSNELVVLFGSESGNSEALADATAKAARQRGYTSRVLDMADIEPKELLGIQNLLVIVSTWGEGDPPETAEAFYHALMGPSAPRLPNLRYSVLALGDTSYEQFCAAGKAFDARLEALGAKRIYPRVDCDVDYDALYQSWSKEALNCFDRLEASQCATVAVLGERAESVVTEPVVYNRKNPFTAELSDKILLNGRGSNKETLHLEFSLKGSGITYTPGDSLAVIPQNCESVVGAILQASKLDPDSQVNLNDEQCTLLEALTSKLDVTTLSAPLLKRYSELAENSKLENLLKPDNKHLLSEYTSGRDLADLLTDFPAKQINPDALVALTRKLPPRLYSIASSLRAHPEAVNLTVGIVRYDAHGRERKGVCSTFLADRLAKGQKAEVFVTPNKHFKLPENPETPIIMVGPGTGIAPFRAFIEERAAIGANGRSWLFFGDQHFLTDFLYQLEWKEYLADGKLTRMDLAFSRDQPKKVYVQDRMRERSRDLYAWLEEGAVFYVCGDATKMAVDVDKALHDCVAREAGLDADGAAEYVAGLKKQKRYLRDVY